MCSMEHPWFFAELVLLFLLIWSLEDNQETQLVPAAVQSVHSCAANEEMKGFRRPRDDGSNVSK